MTFSEFVIMTKDNKDKITNKPDEIDLIFDKIKYPPILGSEVLLDKLEGI
jgi:hypothetical protein